MKIVVSEHYREFYKYPNDIYNEEWARTIFYNFERFYSASGLICSIWINLRNQLDRLND